MYFWRSTWTITFHTDPRFQAIFCKFYLNESKIYICKSFDWSWINSMMWPDREECVHWLGSVPENSSSHRFTVSRLWRRKEKCWVFCHLLVHLWKSAQQCFLNMLHLFHLYTKQKYFLFYIHTVCDSTCWVRHESSGSVVRTSRWKEERHKVNSSVTNYCVFGTSIQSRQTHTFYVENTNIHTDCNVTKCKQLLLHTVALSSECLIKFPASVWGSGVQMCGSRQDFSFS